MDLLDFKKDLSHVQPKRDTPRVREIVSFPPGQWPAINLFNPPAWHRSSDDDGPETVIVLDEASGIVARCRCEEGVKVKQGWRKSHLGAVEV